MTPETKHKSVSRKQHQSITVLAVISGALLIGGGYWFLTQRTTEENNPVTNVNTAAANVNTKSNQAASNSALSSEDAIEEYGFWVPALNQSTPKKTSQGDTTSYDFGSGNAVSIMSQDAKTMVTASLSNTKEEPLTIDGYTATRVTGVSAKDGSQVIYLLIDVDEQLYFVRGTEQFRDSVETEMQLP